MSLTTTARKPPPSIVKIIRRPHKPSASSCSASSSMTIMPQQTEGNRRHSRHASELQDLRQPKPTPSSWCAPCMASVRPGGCFDSVPVPAPLPACVPATVLTVPRPAPVPLLKGSAGLSPHDDQPCTCLPGLPILVTRFLAQVAPPPIRHSTALPRSHTLATATLEQII